LMHEPTGRTQQCLYHRMVGSNQTGQYPSSFSLALNLFPAQELPYSFQYEDYMIQNKLNRTYLLLGSVRNNFLSFCGSQNCLMTYFENSRRMCVICKIIRPKTWCVFCFVFTIWMERLMNHKEREKITWLQIRNWKKRTRQKWCVWDPICPTSMLQCFFFFSKMNKLTTKYNRKTKWMRSVICTWWKEGTRRRIGVCVCFFQDRLDFCSLNHEVLFGIAPKFGDQMLHFVS
jgi:hypothetical protein